MAYYNVPTNKFDRFNMIDFADNNDEYLTILVGDNRYIKNGGSVVSGNYVWMSENSFISNVNFNNDLVVKDSTIKIYDVNNNNIGYFDNMANILCNNLNNISNQQLGFLENISSDVQFQLDDKLENSDLNEITQNISTNTNDIDDIFNIELPLKSNITYVNQQLALKTNEEYVNNQISALIDSSPDLLNTLSELSGAINNDEDFSNTVMTEISKKASKIYVDDELALKASKIYVDDELALKAYC